MTLKLSDVLDDEHDKCVFCGIIYSLDNMYWLIQDKATDTAYNVCESCKTILHSRNPKKMVNLAYFMSQNKDTTKNVYDLLLKRFPLLRRVSKSFNKRLKKEQDKKKL